MRIRYKLLLYFLSLSMLILVADMFYYYQLKNLVVPLTPRSIPLSIAKLEKSIRMNNLIYQILYFQKIVQYDLEEYVLTNKLSSLYDYYMNRSLLEKLVENSKIVDSEFGRELSEKIKLIYPERDKILFLMKENDYTAAREILFSNKFTSLRSNITAVLNDYYSDFDVSTNEGDLVTVKLAAKNTISVLYKSLHATFIIFLDAIMISLVFAIVSANAISRPISLLKKNMDTISSDNLDVSVSPDLLKLKGEVGDLSRSFSKLIVRLQSTTVSRDKLLVEIERRVQSEENLYQSTLSLEESNRKLDDFAYSTSHDLRAPLRNIENLSQLIIDDCYNLLPDESRQHLLLIKDRVQELDHLVQGILDYTRASKQGFRKELINLNELLNEVIGNLSPPKHMAVIIDMNLPAIKINRAMMMQVFLNLISNAIKFHDKKKGSIHVGFELFNDYYQFYVKDDGSGIHQEDFEKIFAFLKTVSGKHTTESSGIGLSLVRKIVENQGGKVWVESIVGKGSTFYFTYPKP